MSWTQVLNEQFLGPDVSLRYRLSFPLPTPSLNEIRGLHFAAYRRVRKAWQMEVWAALGGRNPKVPLELAFIVLTRECHGETLDWDNAYGGLKPLLDCLVVASDANPDGLGLIRDDSPRNMPLPPFIRQIPAKPGKGRTVLEIFELQERPS